MLGELGKFDATLNLLDGPTSLLNLCAAAWASLPACRCLPSREPPRCAPSPMCCPCASI